MLKSVRVKNYKSIADSGNVNLNGGLTTLVGGNEAGKTNFLEALTFLGSPEEIPEDDLCDYNRDEWVTQNSSDILILEVVTTIQFLITKESLPSTNRRNPLDEEEFGPPEKIGEEILDIVKNMNGIEDDIYIRRYADGTHYIEPRDKNTKRIYTTLLIYVRIFEIIRQITTESIISEMRSKIRALRRNVDNDGNFQECLDEFLSYIEENHDAIAEQCDDRGVNLIDEMHEIIESYKDNSPISVFESDIEYLCNIYFIEDVNEMEDEVKPEQLKGASKEDPTYTILDHEELLPDEAKDLEHGKVSDRRVCAGETLSEEFNKYWSQSDIDIEIEISWGRASLQFYDKNDGEYNKDLIRKNPSSRSKGLRRFLSIIIQLITKLEPDSNNSIMLFDNPDVHLHPEGKKNLRESFINIAKDNQLIFSTHSPYMIDTKYPSDVRIAKRIDGKGTKIKPLGNYDEPSDDVLSPVRAALGATFSDSLFSSSRTVLVEGYQDRLYLNGFSEYYKENEGGEPLHSDTRIINCGGAGKMRYMWRLVAAEDYDYFIVLDGDEQGKRTSEQLIQEGATPENIILVSDIVDDCDKPTIEDLFSDEFYCKVSSKIHNIPYEKIQKEMPAQKDGVVNSLDSCIKKIEKSDEVGVKKMEIAEKISDDLCNHKRTSDDLDEISVERFRFLISEINKSFEDGGEYTDGRSTTDNDDGHTIEMD